MRYISIKNERESDSKGSFNSSTKRVNIVKRLLVLGLMTISLAFAGAQSAPTANANPAVDYVCGDPFIDPNDGQCYRVCCPADPEVKAPCVMQPCGTR